MKSIRIQNLRSLVDTQEIELNGLTVLLGENSSGKSTFIRSFPLIKQSIETVTTTALLWYGNYVDFGSFSESVNRKNSNRISMDFTFDNIDLYKRRYRVSDIGENISSFKISLEIQNKDKGDYISNIKVYIEGNIIELYINKRNDIEKLIINKCDYTDISDYKLIYSNGIIPLLVDNRSGRVQVTRYLEGNYFFQKIYELIKDKVTLTEDEVVKLLRYLRFKDKSIIFPLKSKKSGVFKIWIDLKSKLDKENLLELNNLFLGYLLGELLFCISEKVNDFYYDTFYIAPIRANAERYYRMQNLSVNDVDFQGRNLPMLLANLSEAKLDEFAKWTARNFGFSVKPVMTEGHISLNVIKDKETVNIADCGFGYSQVLPIITQLWLILNRKNEIKNRNITVVIEQPELHLHPRMQANLIDTFVSCINIANKNKIKLKLIIETHSEVMIDRIGYLIEHKNINKENVNIYIFNKKNVDETEIKESHYDDEGQLVEWPWDFFEVSE